MQTTILGWGGGLKVSFSWGLNEIPENVICMDRLTLVGICDFGYPAPNRCALHANISLSSFLFFFFIHRHSKCVFVSCIGVCVCACVCIC